MDSRSDTSLHDRVTLQPSFLGKYVGLDTCPQFFKFRLQDAAEEHLNHKTGDFKEAFEGGNIIEKKAGDEFERDVVQLISEHVTDFYDIEQATLAMAAEARPDAVRSELTDPFGDLTGKSRDDIRSLDFTYCGVDPGDITLGDVDGFCDQVELDIDESIADLINSSEFYGLRVAYTEELIAQLIENSESHPADTALNFTTPATKTSNKQTGTGSRPESDPIVVFQPSFQTTIGAWPFAGDADLVLIWPGSDETQARVRVIDVKLALEEQAHHQIQAVTYSRAIAQLDAVSADEISLETGIISQQSSFFPLTPDGVPEFDRDSRETDLHRLTKKGGKIDTVYWQDYEDISFQLDSKCSSCEFNEACYTMAIENAGLELLGINRGVQRTLKAEGIETLNDLARLAEPIDTETHPSNTKRPTPRDKQTYNKLAMVPGLGEQLPTLIQKAQVFLGNLNPDNRSAYDASYPTHITNTGYGELPADHFINVEGNGDSDTQYREGSMIRVYLNVQYDHIRDAIDALGFYVTATASTTDPISYGVVDEDLPDGRVETHRSEVELLEEFTEELFDAIERVGAGINLDGYVQNNPFLHFFTYTEQEKQILEERLALYTNGRVTVESTLAEAAHTSPGSPCTVEVELSDEVRALRKLLGQRDGADQPMVSAVAPEIKSRMAVLTPTIGLINIYARFYSPFQDEQPVPNAEWTYTPRDPSRLPSGETEIDLQRVFDYRFFNNSVEFVEDTDSIRLLHSKDHSEDPDGWYTSRVRTAAQIPIAYIWAATGKLTEKWDLDNELSEEGVAVNPYVYHDQSTRDVRVTTEDVEALLEYLCQCLARVEQGISTRSTIYAPNLHPDEDGDTQ